LNHGVYFFVIEGKVNIAGDSLEQRDALGIWATDSVSIQAETELFLLVLEVPLKEE